MKLQLTDFSEIATQSFAKKASKIKDVLEKGREPYSPQKDFYKRIRSAVVALHKGDAGIEGLDSLMFTLSDRKKRARYALLIPGYKRWMGKKKFGWVAPPQSTYQYRDHAISVNPEVGLERSGTVYVIKLYFKKDELTPESADVITGVMGLSLPRSEGMIFGVLDVERSRLFVEKKTVRPGLQAIINAELAYIAEMWGDLEQVA
ncbi:hypothetical protein [Lysobacter brunescens]|uniref:Uncharacterized protein n=1 Tax=Lysobacter brunescens TaxID=262323 RepID=A0ABW2Y9W6_9GAMM